MVLWFLAAACSAPKDDTGDTATGTADTADTAADTATDTDSGAADTADSGADTADTGGDTADTGVSASAVPDFSLPDLNAASPRYGQSVSPRDYMEKVSGWYFIHAT